MSFSYEDQLDSMDASFFTGDILYTDLALVKYYLGRWNRAVERMEEGETDESN